MGKQGKQIMNKIKDLGSENVNKKRNTRYSTYEAGMLEILNSINDFQLCSSLRGLDNNCPYMIGDIIGCKLNILKGRPRKNIYYEKFKKGDKVRIKNCSLENNGETGVLTGATVTHNKGVTYYVSMDRPINKKKYWWISQDYLEINE